MWTNIYGSSKQCFQNAHITVQNGSATHLIATAAHTFQNITVDIGEVVASSYYYGSVLLLYCGIREFGELVQSEEGNNAFCDDLTS